jgi:hypothetical protein
VVTLPAAPAVAVSAAGNHTCAITSAGLMYCWGADDVGGTPASATPVQIAGITGAVKLAVGRLHACVADAAGAVRCFGTVPQGTTGFVDVPSTAPQVTTGLVAALIGLVAGDVHTCALLDPGMGQAFFVMCWGLRDAWEPGTPGTISEAPLFASANASLVFASGGGTAIVGAAGLLDLCDMELPPPLTPLLGATLAATVGVGTHGCAAGPVDLRCWGQNHHGQAGVGAIGQVQLPAVVDFP